MTMRAPVLLSVAAWFACAATSFAGAKSDSSDVASVILATPTKLANAAGAMAATRGGTQDSLAKIGCWAIGAPGSVTSYCLATDPAGNTIACSSAVPAIAQVIQGVNPASHIAFTVAADGSCDNVVIDDGSLDGLKR
jgi:hypothetical protein